MSEKNNIILPSPYRKEKVEELKKLKILETFYIILFLILFIAMVFYGIFGCEDSITKYISFGLAGLYFGIVIIFIYFYSKTTKEISALTLNTNIKN